jgi:hypothetical protein
MPSEFFVVQAFDFLGLVRTHSRAAKLERKDIPYLIMPGNNRENKKTFSKRSS